MVVGKSLASFPSHHAILSLAGLNSITKGIHTGSEGVDDPSPPRGVKVRNGDDVLCDQPGATLLLRFHRESCCQPCTWRM